MANLLVEEANSRFMQGFSEKKYLAAHSQPKTFLRPLFYKSQYSDIYTPAQEAYLSYFRNILAREDSILEDVIGKDVLEMIADTKALPLVSLGDAYEVKDQIEDRGKHLFRLIRLQHVESKMAAVNSLVQASAREYADFLIEYLADGRKIHEAIAMPFAKSDILIATRDVTLPNYKDMPGLKVIVPKGYKVSFEQYEGSGRLYRIDLIDDTAKVRIYPEVELAMRAKGYFVKPEQIEFTPDFTYELIAYRQRHFKH